MSIKVLICKSKALAYISFICGLFIFFFIHEIKNSIIVS